MLSSRGGKKSPSGNRKRRRGSFSFFGGMQVSKMGDFHLLNRSDVHVAYGVKYPVTVMHI